MALDRDKQPDVLVAARSTRGICLRQCHLPSDSITFCEHHVTDL